MCVISSANFVKRANFLKTHRSWPIAFEPVSAKKRADISGGPLRLTGICHYNDKWNVAQGFAAHAGGNYSRVGAPHPANPYIGHVFWTLKLAEDAAFWKRLVYERPSAFTFIGLSRARNCVKNNDRFSRIALTDDCISRANRFLFFFSTIWQRIPAAAASDYWIWPLATIHLSNTTPLWCGSRIWGHLENHWKLDRHSHTWILCFLTILCLCVMYFYLNAYMHTRLSHPRLCVSTFVGFEDAQFFVVLDARSGGWKFGTNLELIRKNVSIEYRSLWFMQL